MPHAPASRRVQVDPIAVVERLLADESSQVRGDEEWDFYAQIEDEVAVTQARLTWVDRLSAAQGRQIALEIGLGNSSGTNTVSGELKDVGEGWCAIGIDHQTVIVNSFWIQSIASSTTQPLPTGQSRGGSRRTWSSALRQLGSLGRPVVVHRTLGHPIEVEIVLAASDYFDGRVSHGGSPQHVVSIPYSSVIRVVSGHSGS